MQLERLGVVGFFGIFVPGAYLAAFVLLFLACLLELNGLSGHRLVLAPFRESAVLASSAFFLFAYLLGVVVRMFAPRTVDGLSTNYLRFVRSIFRLILPTRDGDRDPFGSWITEPFPYEESLQRALERDGMGSIPAFIRKLNESYGRENTRYFSYCKLFIEAQSEALAKQVRQGEALVRFLSGACFALIFSTCLGSAAVAAFMAKQSWLLAQLYGFITVFSLLVLFAILQRFKFQRRREVVVVWTSVYLLLTGAVPNGLGISGDELRNRFTVAREAQHAGAA